MAFLGDKIGPATLVAAAFIGPGTVVTCSIAGASFGYSLVWAMLFSMFATMILQEMTGRLGSVQGISLSGALRMGFTNPVMKYLVASLCLLAIVVGNAAYQSGNITGAMIGMIEMFPAEGNQDAKRLIIIWTLGLIVFVLLFFGRYKILERTMIVLVSMMSLVFLITVSFLDIDLSALVMGSFIPTIPDGSQFLIVALFGTTIVPYNLFLHSAAVSEKWRGKENLKWVRLDVFVSVLLGGVISILIIVTSAATLHGESIRIGGLNELSRQLEPFLGNYSTMVLSLGFFAAGLTSTITAPVAAAYTVVGLLGKAASFQGTTFRLSWMIVLFTGLGVASISISPLLLIQIAQFANGLLLPIICIFLFMVMNSKRLGDQRNGWISNMMGGVVLLLVFVLGVSGVLRALDLY